MIRVKLSWLCCKNNFSKWIVNPRIYALAVFMLMYVYLNCHGIAEYAAVMGVKTAPWIFPFFVNTGIMISVYAIAVIFLYCDAPFEDGHTPFVLIRMRRLEWVVGQFMYVILTAVVFTIYTVLIHIIVLMPEVELNSDWGPVIRTLASDASIAYNRGISMMPLDNDIVQKFSAMEAMGISMLQYFLTTVFIGMMIFCFNMISGRSAGIGVAMFFAFFAYFCNNIGSVLLNTIIIRWFSPISWVGMSGVNWWTYPTIPSPVYAIVAQSICIIVFMGMSVYFFYKRDIDIHTGRRF